MESVHSRTVLAPRGFTLVEMMVVLAIIVIITTIALVGQSTFNRSLVLTDVAYTLAFSVREAQSLGLSSRAFAGTQNAGYGVRFSAASAGSYTLFADTHPAAPGRTGQADCPGHPEVSASNPEAKPGDCLQSQASEIVRTYSLNNGFRISSFCGAEVSGGTKRCNGYLDAIDIVYLRPNTQSVITGVRGATRVPLANAVIHVSSPDGQASRCIAVSKAGQISVHLPSDTECL